MIWEDIFRDYRADILITFEEISSPDKIRVKVWIDKDLYYYNDVSFDSFLLQVAAIDEDLWKATGCRHKPFLPSAIHLIKEGKIRLKNSSHPKRPQKNKKQKPSRSPRSKEKQK